ncbi:MAG: hypothetical protein IJL38_01300 [Bacteroidales bacterium]|nr:hypothetical protein [Bacteroidales bacterium]
MELIGLMGRIRLIRIIESIEFIIYIEAIRVIEVMGGKCFAFGKTLSWLGNGSELPLLSHYDNVKKWGGVVVCWKKGLSLQSASGA